jgi:hypothetical protein
VTIDDVGDVADRRLSADEIQLSPEMHDRLAGRGDRVAQLNQLGFPQIARRCHGHFLSRPVLCSKHAGWLGWCSHPIPGDCDMRQPVGRYRHQTEPLG